MKKNFLILSLLGLTLTTSLVSCSRDDDFGTEVTQKSNLNMTFTADDVATYSNLEIEILEVNTGSLIKKSISNLNTLQLDLAYGSYKITANGSVITNTNGTFSVAGSGIIDINTTTSSINIPLFIKQFSQDFIIEEVFYTGVKTADGKNYNSSRYFKLVNNTDKVLYADQLIIGQSEFLTSVNNNVTPYNPNEKFAVKGVMVLPGTGNQYPVQPGDFIVVADNAINHNAVTTNAFDLHNADFEFPSNNPTLGQVDNPSVPNVNVIFTTMTYNMIFLHSSGVESYVIARFPAGEDATTFLQNHKYNYSYTNAAGNTTNKSAYAIPNTWILDGMNNSVQDKFLHLLTGSSIDSGWTGVGAFWNDPARSGKSVRRKTLGVTSTGKNIYKDTNNSTEDFTKNAEPSLKNGIVH
jgi:hypothetical protein